MFKGNRDYKLYIEDIANECKNIRKFVANITYDEFTENLEKVYAVAKAFENIGEAVKNIPRELTKDYSQIPWSEIAKMRDKKVPDTPFVSCGNEKSPTPKNEALSFSFRLLRVFGRGFKLYF